MVWLIAISLSPVMLVRCGRLDGLEEDRDIERFVEKRVQISHDGERRAIAPLGCPDLAGRGVRRNHAADGLPTVLVGPVRVEYCSVNESLESDVKLAPRRGAATMSIGCSKNLVVLQGQRTSQSFAHCDIFIN